MKQKGKETTETDCHAKTETLKRWGRVGGEKRNKDVFAVIAGE